MNSECQITRQHNRVLDIVIIGAGPAGLAAAIQLKRSGLDPVIFEKTRPGGLLHNANLVENYPGFPDGITGKSLASKIVQQSKGLDISIHLSEVGAVTFQQDLFQLQLLSTPSQPIFCRYLLIATGTRPIPLELNNGAMPPGIIYTVSELSDARNREIVVIGAGDAAFDYAIQLAKNNRVTILYRGRQTRCLPLLWHRSHQNPGITHSGQSVVKEIQQISENQYRIRYCRQQQLFELNCHHIVAAIGRKPDDSFLQLASEDLEVLQTNGRLYFAGDVKNGIFRQCAIASGDGLRCAMKIFLRISREME